MSLNANASPLNRVALSKAVKIGDMRVFFFVFRFRVGQST